MNEYRLSRRNQLRRALRPLGYEHVRYVVKRAQIRASVKNYKRSLTPLTREEAHEYFTDRTLAFCLTAGRTGTQFAAALLDLPDEVVARHEPHPCFSWVAREAIRDQRVAQDFLLTLKLPAIKALGTRTYLEASHMFAKGFVEPLLDLALVPRFVLLGRPPRNVALSFLEKYTIPERTFLGKQWLLHPDCALPRRGRMGSPGALGFPGWKRATDYQLCFWYAVEMERRQLDYRSRLAREGAMLSELTVSDLHSFSTYVATLEFLGADPSQLDVELLEDRHRETVQRRFNKTTRRNLEFFGDLDRLEEEVWTKVDAVRPDVREWVNTRYGAA